MGALLAHLDGTKWLVVSLLYSTGMRLVEGLRLRVKDVDFERREITVRDGKGAKDRRTMLSERLVEPLRTHLAIPGTGWSAATTTWTRRSSSGRPLRLDARPESKNRFGRTSCATASRRISCQRDTTSGRCKSCLGTPMSQRR